LQLAIGLGNPGRRYALTRHNLGFRVIEVLSRRLVITLRLIQGPCLLGTGRLDHDRIGLAQPATYMNESGRAVAFLQDHLNLEPKELLVICDDVNLPLGKIRLRRGGSDGGHRGLASVIATLASTEFPRLRLGVGMPPEGEDLVDYVLQECEPEEQPLVAEMIEGAADAVVACFQEGLETAMNRFNA
jgi:PTH1 family peptidyl-tRNA hydrolase